MSKIATVDMRCIPSKCYDGATRKIYILTPYNDGELLNLYHRLLDGINTNSISVKEFGFYRRSDFTIVSGYIDHDKVFQKVEL